MVNEGLDNIHNVTMQGLGVYILRLGDHYSSSKIAISVTS